MSLYLLFWSLEIYIYIYLEASKSFTLEDQSMVSRWPTAEQQIKPEMGGPLHLFMSQIFQAGQFWARPPNCPYQFVGLLTIAHVCGCLSRLPWTRVASPKLADWSMDQRQMGRDSGILWPTSPGDEWAHLDTNSKAVPLGNKSQHGVICLRPDARNQQLGILKISLSIWTFKLAWWHKCTPSAFNLFNSGRLHIITFFLSLCSAGEAKGSNSQVTFFSLHFLFFSFFFKPSQPGRSLLI